MAPNLQSSCRKCWQTWRLVQRSISTIIESGAVILWRRVWESCLKSKHPWFSQRTLVMKLATADIFVKGSDSKASVP
ncbi:hypothetical protein JZ751_005562 [Albula glossodonta]|uniref:Uncharacterized protein n=1 Tax=Albula glossodonta TaxID=121402 RepID=A0A8T2N460_9TELE|nr:hypothetical protein JZ751_005562 [Albula glossodonta]